MARTPAGSRAPAVATALAVASVGCAVGAIVLHRHVAAGTAHRVLLDPADVVLGTAYPLVAALVVAHQPRNRAGWLLLSTAWIGPYLLAGQYAALSLLPGSDPFGWQACAWLAIWGYWPYFVLVGLVPLHFPDGRLPSEARVWRRLRATVVGLIAVGILARMLAPIGTDAAPALRNPLALDDGDWLNVTTLVSAEAAMIGAGGCGLVAVLLRLRRSSGEERARMQWLALGVVCLVLAVAVGSVTSGRVSSAAFCAGLVLLLAAMAAGIVRHRLFDIGTALSRTLVYAPLTGLLLVAYAATVAGAGTLPTGRRLTYAAIALTAVAAAAARDQLQRLVDRLVFGERGDPYAVLRRVHGRLDLATGPVDALAQVLAGVRTALRLPYLAVLPSDDRLPVLRDGSPVGDTEQWRVRDRSEQVGSLVVGHRRAGEEFSPSERAVLDDLAHRAGVLLGSAALLHDLQRSREQLVAAREEERLRLRRDLHDSIGPRLAAMAMQLDGVTARLPQAPGTDPELAHRAEWLAGQLRETVSDLRRVMEDLRPPALDELGLVGALEQLVEPYGSRVTLSATGTGSLPPATEVAAYRIAAEAVTNAVRHSGCRSCCLSLRREEAWLVVEASDDGHGIAPDAAPGVGLRSIRERASEVGGRLEVTERPGGGTVVRARVPVPRGAEQPAPEASR